MLWNSVWRDSPPADKAKRPLKRKNSLMAYGQQHSNHFSGPALDNVTTPTRFISLFFKAILATAIFRCWHIIIFYIGWSTMVTLINVKVTSLTFQPTLLTVVGTVLGFVVSYRTTSSFERYNEGRRLWSQIIYASRTLARAVWFHVPESIPPTSEDERENRSEEERKARNLIEKKTVINLIEAFAVAVKHYLRGEEGIAYVDLYHLVKFLPSYAFPAGVIPNEFEMAANQLRTQPYRDELEKVDEEKDEARSTGVDSGGIGDGIANGNGNADGVGISVRRPTLPEPVSVEPPTPGGDYSPAAPADGIAPQPHISLGILPLPATASTTAPSKSRRALRASFSSSHRSLKHERPLRRAPTFVAAADDQDVTLLPASLPPKHSVFDVFPFSLLVKLLTTKGRTVEGKKAAKLRAKTVVVTRNVPLEISMYLTSYVATLGARKAIDVPTNNLLILSVNQLTDALTGLERILTTPIPFSYSIHLWLVTIIYNLALPFQIYSSLKWLTIPASGFLSFIFFGFLVAGEEIENPFGYDKNDLNMDHFTHNIIRNELRAMTAFPPPAPELWAFSPRNDRVFATTDSAMGGGGGAEKSSASLHAMGSTTGLGMAPGMDNRSQSVRGFGGVPLTPDEWARRGTGAIKDALARAH